MDPKTSAIVVFGDQTHGYADELSTLLHLENHALLQSFFGRVAYALRREVVRLRHDQQNLFPRFVTLADLLAERSRSATASPPIELALLCTTQLGAFIRYHIDSLKPYPSGQHSYALGLCTGSFAAAAVSVSHSTSELVHAATEAILVAFRVGLRVLDCCKDLQAEPAGWAVAVPLGPNCAEAGLASFAKNARSSMTASRPYISAKFGGNVCISGSPATIARLSDNPAFRDMVLTPLQVPGAFHAPHLYSSNDVDAIVSPCGTIVDELRSQLTLLSASSGERVEAASYRHLLQEAVNDVLTRQLRWDLVLRHSSNTFNAHTRVEILPCLASLYSLSSTLEAAGIKTKLLQRSSSELGEDAQTSQLRPDGNTSRSKIAIIGYAGRFPNAISADELWDNVLYPGLDTHRQIPADRFDVSAHYDESGRTKNTSKIQHGCFIEEPGLFDARFFHLSPREAANSDPSQRLALATAYEALEMAGFVSNRTPFSQANRVGVFYGTTSDDWREVNSGQDIDTYFIPGGNRAFVPGRINYHFKFSGPSYSVDTACSSSFAAIHTACNALWTGDIDTAVAGGTNILTNPDNFSGLDRGHFLSATGNCNTFDDAANGYCRADAVGTVILKRYEDAIADNDPIKAVIIDAYTNHSAEAESITRPDVGAQAFIFNKVLSESAIDPLDVSYIEMHGTGTQHGDATEMSSVLEVFDRKPRAPKDALYLGSVKSNVGHAESASGVTGLIKVLKMMERNEIPPHCGIKTKINHRFPTDLEARNIRIALKPAPWERPANAKRRVFLNNFSAAGGNTALLIEDGPAKTSSSEPSSSSEYLVAMSAKSKASMRSNLAELVRYLERNPHTSLQSLAYTTTARRSHHNLRVAVSGSDLQTVKLSLASRIKVCDELKPIPLAARKPNTIFVFTGQGALYNKLAQQLFQTNQQFRMRMQKFDQIAQSQGFPSFIGLTSGSLGSLDEATPLVCQVAQTCGQMALAQLWRSWGIAPTAVIGHSVGEYAALYIAGVLSAHDAIYLVGTRARLLQDRCTAGTHSMLAIKAALPVLQNYITNAGCEVACINGPEDVVLSGTTASIDSIIKSMEHEKIRSTKLELPYAFHSSHVECILEDFENLASAASFGKPNIPYMSPLLGRVVRDDSTINASYLAQACRKTVDWQQALLSAQHEEVFSEKDIWLEIGPHPICNNMVKAVLGQTSRTVASLKRQRQDWSVLNETLSVMYLSGMELNWGEINEPAEVLQLPSYQWDNQNHWIQYRNNFCLTKGDAPDTGDVQKPLATSAVQKVVEERLNGEDLSITCESDLRDPCLRGVVEGHKVNGATLCSSSFYADVALTLSSRLAPHIDANLDHLGFNVGEMKIEKPLIIGDSGPVLIRATVKALRDSRQVSMELYGVDKLGKRTVTHATCQIYLEDPTAWSNSWRRNTYLIKSRIDSLETGVDAGESHKIKRGLAYKLFGAIVDYGECYQGMQEIILNSPNLEATAKVCFQTTDSEENHHTSPCWIDSLGGIAGFIMNANDGIDSKRQVFINHGWDAMRCSAKLSRDKTYRTYNRMQLQNGTLYAGDTYVFEEDQLIAVFEGVKFQGVPRQVLDNLLPNAQGAAPSKKASMHSPPAARPSKKDETPQPALTEPAKSTKGSVAAKLLTIIADETGVGESELMPTTAFVDIGIDSLLALNIAGRLREAFGLDCASSVLSDYPTVVQLTKHLGGSESSLSPELSTPELARPSSSPSTQPSTPELESMSAASSETDATIPELDSKDLIQFIRRALAKEIGVDEADITTDLNLSELGVDSLLALNVLGAIRSSFDIDPPPALFAENRTLGEVAGALGLDIVTPEAKSTAAVIDVPPASSILLQGNPQKGSRKLFLFPDGSGSATSYAHLPQVSPDVAIYGLNCPFMKSPEKMRCGLSDMTPSYIQELRRRQPHGPYSLGGWSAGGIAAMDAAQQLIRAGEGVEKLILIDSPNPNGLEKLPPRLYDFFADIQLFGSGTPPKWLLPHFLAFVDALDCYKPQAFVTGTAPQTHIIWAEDGVCRDADSPRPEPQDDDPREMNWLLNNRTDFGPNGWDKLIPAQNIRIERMADANHFSMVHDTRKSQELAVFVRNAMLSTA